MSALPMIDITTVTDWKLLDRFATMQDQAAFTELVRRHIHMVYGAARRMLGGPAAEADDVTQAVFLLLSQKARTISRQGALAGWLFTATRFCCANVRKTQARRRRHEQEAAMLRPTAESSESPESPLTRLLDEGLTTLAESERQAILLRFLERRNTRESAAILAISPGAVEKRLERGLNKLRGFFSRRGHIVPVMGIAALLGAESARAAPPALAPAAAAVASAAPASILALAKGAATLMSIQSAKLVGVFAAALLMLAGFGVVTVISLARTVPATAPVARGGSTKAAADPALAALIGTPHPRIARWDLVVSGIAAQHLRALGAAAKPAGIGYEMTVVDPEKLRAAALAEDAAGQIFLRSNSMSWATPSSFSGGNSHIFTFARLPGNTQVLVDTGTIAGISTEGRDQAMRLQISDKPHPAGVGSPGAAEINGKNMQLDFSGDIAVGQAAVFFGDLGTSAGQQFVHILVWQTFSCSESEFRYFNPRGGSELDAWLHASVEERLAIADRIIAWNARARPAAAQTPPAWTKILPGGTVISLLAVSDETRWPGCWWDGDGNPVLFMAGWGYFSKEREAGPERRLLALLVEDPHAPAVKADPMSAEAEILREAPQHAVTVTTVSVAANGQSPVLECGAGSGPWNDAGVITVGKTVTIDSMKVTLQQVQTALPRSESFAGNAWLKLRETLPRDRELAIVGIDKNGVESLPEAPPLILAQEKPPEDQETTVMVNMDAADVDHYVVRWRKREWTTLEKYAAAPAISPDKISVATAAAAIETRPAPTAPATGPVLGETPENLWPALAAAAHTQDVAKVRALIEAHGPVESSLADMFAEDFVSADVLRDALSARFKPEDVAAAFAEPGLLPSFQATNADVVWKVEGDHATPVSTRPDVMLTGGPGSTLVRVAGRWKIDVALPADMTAEQTGQLQKYLPFQARVAAARGAFAVEIAKGTYKDIYDARDAFRKQLPVMSP